jgi:hypothetical protein
MSRSDFSRAAAFASALLCAAGSSFAQDTAATAQEEHVLREHPAVLVKRQGPVLDTNRFILAHPAQLAVIEAPSPTYDHPAIAVQRMARESAELERNIAEPPVASAWLRRHSLAASVETKASGS